MGLACPEWKRVEPFARQLEFSAEEDARFCVDRPNWLEMNDVTAKLIRQLADSEGLCAVWQRKDDKGKDCLLVWAFSGKVSELWSRNQDLRSDTRAPYVPMEQNYWGYREFWGQGPFSSPKFYGVNRNALAVGVKLDLSDLDNPYSLLFQGSIGMFYSYLRGRKELLDYMRAEQERAKLLAA